MKTGGKWMNTLIRLVWEMTFQLWEHRNNILHDKEYNMFEQEEKALRKAVRQEWDNGAKGLDPIVRRYYRTTRKNLLKYKIERLKDWFTVVRAAREVIGVHILHNALSDDKQGLRTWVGLK